MAAKKRVHTRPVAGIPATPSTAPSTPTPAPTTPTVPVSASPPTPAATPSPTLMAPALILPTVPAGFVPVNQKNYRGDHPKAAQITALPDAITELETSSSYAAVFGAAAPAATQLAADLTTAQSWTALRIPLVAFVQYVRSNEAVAWKTAMTGIDGISAAFKVLAAQNPTVAAQFPALQRLVDVPKVIAARGAATKARKVKAKAATPAPAPTATAAPATAASNASTAKPAGGAPATAAATGATSATTG